MSPTPSTTATVRIVNAYTARGPLNAPRVPPPGSLTVNKVLAGDAELRGDIQIRVQCEQVPGFDAPFDQTRTIPAGVDPVPPLVFEPVPAPADCTVTEPVTGENDAVAVTVIGAPRAVRVGPNSEVEITITDVYGTQTGSLRVRKLVDGPGASLRGDVTLDVVCTDGTARSWSVPAGQAQRR